MRQSDHGANDSVSVARRPAAEFRQQRGAAERAQHVAGGVFVDRKHAERDVFHRLDRHAAKPDPQFGPFMLVGLGGVTVEAMKDVAIRLLPIDEDTARDTIRSLRGAALLGEFRGRPERDTEAVVRAMVGLSRLFLDHRPWLSDLEINPLIVLGKTEGVRAVDVRVVRRSP